jgi:hypothetical protein
MCTREHLEAKKIVPGPMEKKAKPYHKKLYLAVHVIFLGNFFVTSMFLYAVNVKFSSSWHFYFLTEGMLDVMNLGNI